MDETITETIKMANYPSAVLGRVTRLYFLAHALDADICIATQKDAVTIPKNGDIPGPALVMMLSFAPTGTEFRITTTGPDAGKALVAVKKALMPEERPSKTTAILANWSGLDCAVLVPLQRHTTGLEAEITVTATGRDGTYSMTKPTKGCFSGPEFNRFADIDVPEGSEVEITASGPDEQLALDTAVRIISSVPDRLDVPYILTDHQRRNLERWRKDKNAALAKGDGRAVNNRDYLEQTPALRYARKN